MCLDSGGVTTPVMMSSTPIANTITYTVTSGSQASFSIPANLLSVGNNTVVVSVTDSRTATPAVRSGSIIANVYVPYFTAVSSFANTPTVITDSRLDEVNQFDITVGDEFTVSGGADGDLFLLITNAMMVMLVNINDPNNPRSVGFQAQPNTIMATAENGTQINYIVYEIAISDGPSASVRYRVTGVS